jgi:hypothetical protein
MLKLKNYQLLNHKYKGKRIRLIEIKDDPDPVLAGSEGTILRVVDAGTIHIR